jgi:hypothetical protein
MRGAHLLPASASPCIGGGQHQSGSIGDCSVLPGPAACMRPNVRLTSPDLQ